MNRILLRRFARWIVGCLLLSQLAIAAYACPSLATPVAADDRLERTFDVLDQAIVAASGPDVDGCADAVGAGDPASPHLCAAHCTFGQQSDHAPTVVVAAAPLPGLEYPCAPPALPASVARASAAELSALVAASPPHAILHCVRRT